MNKKKVFAVALAACLIAIVSFSTLAWFTADDAIDNTFTVGSIDIEQIEKGKDAQGNEIGFVQDQTMLPIVNVNDPAADDNYIDKIVTVKSTGKNSAYVRTHVYVPAQIADIVIPDFGGSDKWGAFTVGTATDAAGDVYKVYTFTYTEALGKDQVTDVLLKGVYLRADVDRQPNPAANNAEQFCTLDANGDYVFYDYDITQPIHVYIATQGVQAQGFSNAVSALDSAFGGKIPTPVAD